MTDATVTSQPDQGVTVKPELSSEDGKSNLLISMQNIWKTYDMGAEKVHALHGVSFNVKRGEYLAITGPSGSGKSTLMNLIGCLDTPSQGSYQLKGHEIASMSDDVALQVTASLSPQAQRAMSEAALTGVFVPNYAPPTPDAPTLAGALARLGAPDRQLVITGLAPRLRAEVESSLDAVAAFASCS
jgi:ABC-type iron transport system FetAB ATPase subunit